MVQRTGDLWPAASGSASLGAEQINGMGGFSDEVIPYAHIHANSGVFHGNHGQSGVLRFNQEDNVFEVSVNGGLTYTALSTGGAGISTLQEAYDGGQTIYIDGAQDMQISAGNHKLRLGTDGDKAEVSLSGLVENPVSDLEVGDLSMIVHSQEPWNGGTTVPASNAEAAALSLGIGGPVVNTSSGVVNLCVSSGVTQFINTTIQTVDIFGISLDFLAAGNSIPDKHYLNTTGDDIMILVPGLYRAHYNVSFTKTTGTTRQQVDTELRLNNKVIFGSPTHTYLRTNSVTNKGTSSAMVLFDANARDIVRVFCILPSSPAGNTITTIAREGCLVIERLGPKRGLVTVSPT